MSILYQNNATNGSKIQYGRIKLLPSIRPMQPIRQRTLGYLEYSIKLTLDTIKLYVQHAITVVDDALYRRRFVRNDFTNVLVGNASVLKPQNRCDHNQ